MKQLVRRILKVIEITLKALAIIVFLFVGVCLLGHFYRDGGGLWGLFLWICSMGLVVAVIATIVVSAISLEMWLESDDKFKELEKEGGE